MKSHFEKMIGIKVPCDYRWDDDGIVRIGANSGSDDIRCWICGEASDDDDIHPVIMRGNNKIIRIGVLCCQECQEEIEDSKDRSSRKSALIGLVAYVITLVIVFLLTGGSAGNERLLMCLSFSFLAGVFSMILGFKSFKHRHWDRIAEHPLIKLLLEKQWKM